MAATLGTVTSILQLVDTALTARDYIQDFRHAPEERRTLLSEMEHLRPLLKELHDRIQSNQPSGQSSSYSSSIPQQMEKPLSDFQKTMEGFQQSLKPAGTLKDFSRRMKWPLWGKKESKEYLGKFEQFKSLLNGWLLLDIWDSGQQQRSDHQDILKSVEDAADEQRQAHDLARRTKIIEWLAPINFFQRQADISRARQPGTGGWLLEDGRFKQWEAGSQRILWCRGIPGSGKTILASMVVDHLEAQFDDQDMCVACMYLNHKERDTQTVSNLLASIWSQVVVDKTISSLAQKLHERHSKKRTQPKLDEVSEVLRLAVAEWGRVYIVVDALDEYPEDERNMLLRHLIAMGPHVSLMLTSRPHIDLGVTLPDPGLLDVRATDEDIKKYVNERIRKSSRLSMHVQTRPELPDEIESKIISTVDGMFLLAKLHIDSLATKNTIKSVRGALENLPKDLEHTYDEAMERIDRQNEDDRKIAHSALTWVANAKRVLSARELREALAIEPEAERLDPDNLLEVTIILSVCAGLLIFDETSSAVRLVHYTTQKYMDSARESRFPAAHTQITLGLLTYFTFARPPEEENILPQHTVKLFPESDEIAAYPLLDYCQYCFMHAAGPPELTLRDKIIAFLGQVACWTKLNSRWGGSALPWTCELDDWPSPRYSSPLWIAAASNLLGITEHLLDLGVTPSQAETALYQASSSGNIPMMTLLLEKGPDIRNELAGQPLRRYRNSLQAASAEGHEIAVHLLIEKGVKVNSDALSVASYRGHQGVVKFLLDQGADVNAQAGIYGTALHAAAERSHGDIVHMLLENGAEINLTSGGFTPLHAASSRSDKRVVQLLLERGADANAGTQFDGSSALYLASAHGYDTIVSLLISWGADVNLKNGGNTTALHAASHFGHEEVVRLLLDKGHAVDGDGSALRAASVRGYEAIVRLLIDHGADVDLKDESNTDALQVASYWGHESVVQLLLERGADVNAEAGEYGTALAAASGERHTSIARVLIDKGANVLLQDEGSNNASKEASQFGHEGLVRRLKQGSERYSRRLRSDKVDIDVERYRDALHIASSCGLEDIVRLLLARWADVWHPVNGEHGNMLQAASAWGFDALVRLLIDNGADVNSKDKSNTNALQVASYRGHEGVVRLLLERGAEVNEGDGEYGSALQAAAGQGHDPIVHLLFNKGADVNLKDKKNSSALHTASDRNEGDMVALLLERGADVNAVDEEYGSALQAASARGYEPIVRLLLDNGADVNLKDESNTNGLQAASYWGHEDVARLLLERGADVNAEAGEYGTALAVASAEGYTDIVRLLTEKGAV